VTKEEFSKFVEEFEARAERLERILSNLSGDVVIDRDAQPFPNRAVKPRANHIHEHASS
jgi:hypothetical protein